MSMEIAATVFAGLIFFGFAYVLGYKVKYGYWPWRK